MATTRMAMWVHGVSVFPENTAGNLGTDGPLVQVNGIPWSDVVGLRQGFGATFRGKGQHSNWFHFSIPTPVLVPVFHSDSQTYDQPYGQRVRLERVFVLHRTESFREGSSGEIFAKAYVAQVHVWDGAQTRYFALEQFGEAPDEVNRGDDGQHHLGIQDWENSWPVNTDATRATIITPEINWGVCISVRIHFGDESDVFFAAAGADFLLDVA